MKNEDLKQFVVRKYVMAKNAAEAIRAERDAEVCDVWVDEDWKKDKSRDLSPAIGFDVDKQPEP